MAARGSSGSWVVRDGLLCGCIVAVYDTEPYAHMISADKMLSDIARFYDVNDSEVRVATEDDVLQDTFLHAPTCGITPALVSEKGSSSGLSSSPTVITQSREHKHNLFVPKMSKHRTKRIPTPSAKKQYNFEQYERFRKRYQNRRRRKSEQRELQGLGYPLVLRIPDWIGCYCLGLS
jgi:hypothetical protein